MAEAVCVGKGRVLHVGSLADVRAVAGSGAKEVDLGGGVLYPGFIDTHSHLSSYANCLDKVECGISCGTIAGVNEKLRAKIPSLSKGEWLLGYGYDDSGIADKRHLNRHDLDAVSSEIPIFIIHISVHFAYANTKALELLGITRYTKIDGGEVGLGEDGAPSGYLEEMAAMSAMARLPEVAPEALRANLARAVGVYNSQGFTTFMDGGIGLSGDPAVLMHSYLDLDKKGELNARAYLQLLPEVMDRFAPYGVFHFGSDHLTIGGLKYFIDGSIQGFTAALMEDYHTRPGFKSALLFPEKDIEAIVLKHHLLGIQVAIHTNGDYAIETALRAFEKAVAQDGRRDLHHMLVHAQTASESQLARMKACGVIPSFFGRHIEVWGDRHATVFLGPERTARLNPAGSAVRLGMPFSLHVDSPVLPVTALGCMHAAVNRVSSGGTLFGEDQGISPLEALRAYTTYASLCCGGEYDRGRIEPGRYADFTLLSDNLETVAPETIRDVRVKMTVCGGRIVHQA
jgi:predicted amidohydrolase YtcJ